MFYSYLIIASSVVSLLLLVLLLKYIKHKPGRALSAIALLGLFIQLSRLLAMFSVDAERAAWWHNINLNLYVFLAPAAFAFLYFVVDEFHERRWEGILISVVSLSFFIIGVTPVWRDAFIRSIEFGKVDGLWTCLYWEPGYLFVLSWLFSNIVALRIFSRLWRWTKSSNKTMRSRGWLALWNILFSAISSSFDFFNFSWKPGFVFMPLILGAVGMSIIIGIWFFDIFDILPLAHETVVQRMAEGVIVITPEHKIINVNSPGANFLGVSKEDLIGKNIFEFVPPPEKGSRQEQNFLTGDYHDQIRIVRDGGERLFGVLVTNLYTGERILARLIILRDLTEFQETRKALRESETRYRLLAENIVDVIWVFDTHTGRFKYFSPSVEHLRGYTAEEALAQSMDELFTPETFEKLDSIFPSRVAEFLGGGDGYYVDLVEQPCKDGSTVWVEAVMQFVKNPDSGHIEVYGVSRDISERLELAKQERELVALEERQRLARDLHDAVSQTLFSARLTAEVLLQQKGKIESEILWKNIHHFSDLVKSALGEMRILLLELRPESLENTAINFLLSHLVDALSAQTETEIIFKSDVEKELPVDVKIALYRIAQESLNNAIKHAYGKQISIQIISKEEFAELIIEDDGRGFSDAEKRGDRLGLTIMQERATEIGATLKIENQPEKGTRISCIWKPEGEENV